MGHVYLREIPTTREWEYVAALIDAGANPRQIAKASINAAEEGFNRCAKDDGVIETLYLMLQLPHAARDGNFMEALNRIGVKVSRDPQPLELMVAVSQAIDRSMANCINRTDYGEMAQMAFMETWGGIISGQFYLDLYLEPHESFQKQMAKFATVVQMGRLARRFITRLMFKCLDYYLGRVTKLHAGIGHRFESLDAQSQYMESLEKHCFECALVVERFTGEWASKQRFEHGHIDRTMVKTYAHGAMAKLLKALRREEILRVK